jgi:Rv2525c-like, glycoside hydrolase-like domain
MKKLAEALAKIVGRLRSQHAELRKAERRYVANRKRAFKAHNEQKRDESAAAKFAHEGHPRAAERKRNAAQRAEMRAIKNHKRALYWRAVGETAKRHIGKLHKDRVRLEAEIRAYERKHPQTLQGVDWAWGDISPTALKSAGKHFAMRYLSHDAGKNLTPAEAKRLSNGGVMIGVVWESTGTRAGEGHAAGVADAKAAKTQAAACGKPPSAPIFFAVDYEASPAALDAYFDGVASVLGKDRCGPYGDIAVCTHLMDRGFAYSWQTYAWSYGRWEHRAQLQQFSNDHTLAGVGVDYDRSTTADAGLWRTH